MIKREELKAKPEWRDWKWQLRNRIKTVEQLAEWIHLTEDETKAIEATKSYFRWQITPYYASLMDPENPEKPALLEGSLVETDPVKLIKPPLLPKSKP